MPFAFLNAFIFLSLFSSGQDVKSVYTSIEQYLRGDVQYVEITICNPNDFEIFIQCPNNDNCDSLFLRDYELNKFEVSNGIVDLIYPFRLTIQENCSLSQGYSIMSEDSVINYQLVAPLSSVTLRLYIPGYLRSKKEKKMILIFEYYIDQKEVEVSNVGKRSFFRHFQKFYLYERN